MWTRTLTFTLASATVVVTTLSAPATVHSAPHSEGGIVRADGEIIAASLEVGDEHDIEFGKAIRKLHPAYPQLARAKGETGTVVVIATIARDGTVVDAQVRDSAGERLDTAAKTAAMRWRFTPTTYGGEPVGAVALIRITFSE